MSRTAYLKDTIPHLTDITTAIPT